MTVHNAHACSRPTAGYQNSVYVTK